MLVGVYGSLKKSFGNHSLLQSSKFVGTDKTPEVFRMYSLGSYPAIIPAKEGYPIHLELYEVDNETLQRLDWLEGHPDFYKREVVTTLGNQEAWVYVYQGDLKQQPEIEDGCWKKTLYN